LERMDGELVKELEQELATMGTRIAMVKSPDGETIRAFCLGLEKWLVRAQALDKTWPEIFIARVRELIKNLDSGWPAEQVLVRAMTLMIEVSKGFYSERDGIK